MTRTMMILLSALAPAAAALAAEPVVEVPVQRVVLFSGGVGYFEHEGKVTGNATVRLMFQADQINDVLKTMSVSADKGTVAGVNYASSDPLLRTLKSFAVDLSADPKLADLLKQLRGAGVSVYAPNSVRPMTGKILGVETQKRDVVAGGVTAVVSEAVLNLVTPEGIRPLPMSQIGRIELADRKLADELDRALAVLIGSHDTLRKPVDIRFVGQGERTVRIGYLVEVPVWKTSYRLDLSAAQPRIQGWAVVENTSEADWSGVELTLVSGKPVSFVTDLYTPLRLRRTIVEPKRTATEKGHAILEADYGEDEDGGWGDEDDKPKMKGYRRVRHAVSADTLAGRLYGRPGRQSTAGLFEDDTAGGGVEAVAEAERVGELFRFVIKTPVNIGRRRSAMLPIIHSPIVARKVSIYDRRILDRRAMNGAYVTNDTGLKMLGGPVTVFDGKTFAGEAMLDTLVQKDRALLSYAVDLHVTAEGTEKTDEKVVSAAIDGGSLLVRLTMTTTWTYGITNTDEKPRQMVLRVPCRSYHKLVEPTAAEQRTADECLFKVDVPAGGTRKFVVRMDAPGWGGGTLLDSSSLPTAGRYARNAAIPKDVREALTKVVEAGTAIRLLSEEITATEKQIDEIKGGQKRLLTNIKTLEPTHALAKRYVDKLGSLEDEIEKLEKQLAALEARAAKDKDAFEKLVKSIKAGDPGVLKWYEETTGRTVSEGGAGGIFE
jgi:hypothetical protein